MTKTIGLQLIVYSLLLAGLSYVCHHLAPSLAQPTLIVGLVGGALCLVSGIRTSLGHRGKALPLLALVAVILVTLSQTVIAWSRGGVETEGGRSAAAVITVLFVLSVGMLMRVAYAGVILDGQPANATKDGRN